MLIKDQYRWKPLAFGIACLWANQVLYAQEVLDQGEDEVEMSHNALNTVGLGSIVVKGQQLEGKEHQEQHDEVYDRSISSVYRDKTEIERFKGAAPADVLKEWSA